MFAKLAVFYLTVLLYVNVEVQATIFDFDLVLYPSQEYVQYNDGYIRGPGSIDLSGLTFTAISEAYVNSYDDEYVENDDDDGFGERHLTEISTRQRALDGGIETDAFYVDIAVFPLPRFCAHTKNGCDWPTLGVGKRGSDNEIKWCCSEETVKLGLCSESEENLGRLIIDKEKFQGETRFLSVPTEEPMTKHLRYGTINEKKSGTYVVLYANCNDDGREISVKGQAVWKSKHGYLPGELFGFMYFYTFITLVYFSIFGWFAFLMKQHKETRIEIEKWIIFSIGLGLIEMSFRSMDYYVWNGSGFRSPFIIWVGIIFGVLKQGISRCLAVMVSMGWGVSRDTLSNTARIMSVGLGLAYIVNSALSDGLIVFAVEHVHSISTVHETELINFVSVLGFFNNVINVTFMVWVLHALGKTTKYLESNNEKNKLVRMQQLQTIFICAALFAIAMILFSFIDRKTEEGIVAEEHAWAKDAASEVNYLFVLIGIAMLWRPNESAQHYAYFKELAPIYDDDDDDLELSDIHDSK